MIPLRVAPPLVLLVLAGCARVGFEPPGSRPGGPDLSPSSSRETGGSSVDAIASLADAAGSRLEGGWRDWRKPDLGGVVPGTWIKISPGTFTMGSPPNEPCRASQYETLRQVTLTHGFEILSTEVTWSLVATTLGQPAQGCPSCPMAGFKWAEAAAFCNKLSAIKGLTPCYSCSGSGALTTCTVSTAFAGKAFYTCPGYRLPTEAEWEYAYRAGTTTALYNGTLSTSRCWDCAAAETTADAIAWYCANSQKQAHPTGGKQPNAWGLYDMPGNLLEWVNDFFLADLGVTPETDPVGPATGSSHWPRGGSYVSGPELLRAASRVIGGWSSNELGFRPVRSLP